MAHGSTWKEAHVSIFKALGLLGFGRERVIRVPVDRQGRMLADGLPALDGPAIVCAQAGNVNTGAIDPVGAMAASASYLVASDTREPDQYTPEMSRRARGIEVWAALRSLDGNNSVSITLYYYVDGSAVG